MSKNLKFDNVYYAFDGRAYPSKDAAADAERHYHKMQQLNGWYVQNKKHPYSETHDPLGPFQTREEAEQRIGNPVEPQPRR